jgi:surface antigen
MKRFLKPKLIFTLVVVTMLLGVAGVVTMKVPAMASTSVGGNDYPWPNADMNSLSPLKFYYRNCTDYAAYEINEQMGGNTTNNIKFSWSSINYNGDGNAEAWKKGATGKWPIDTRPAVGSVAWWAATSNNKYGHVAIVASVSNNGNTIVVDEYNLAGTGVYGTRTLTNGVTTWPNDFIHIADISLGGSGWPGVGSGATFLGTDHLVPGQIMKSSQYILSGNVQYVLIMQSDGNLVEYSGASAVWANGRYSPGAYLGVQGDGNIVEYNTSGQAIWATNTNGKSLAYLVMQSDGNLVAYNTSISPIWANNMCCHPTGTYLGSDRLYNGNRLTSGYYIRSSDLRYALLMQADGNLVVFGPGYHVLWANGRNGNTGAYLGLQGDGNIVEYSSSGTALWATNTNGKSLSYLVMQSDGNLVAYSTSGSAIWATGTNGKI